MCHECAAAIQGFARDARAPPAPLDPAARSRPEAVIARKLTLAALPASFD